MNGYLDENGNIIETSWERKQREQELREAKKRAALEEKRKAKEFERISKIDQNNIEYGNIIEDKKRKRQLREKRIGLPAWIKEMPVTPLSAPPTQGKMNKARYKATKKVVLTTEEHNQRVKNLRRVKESTEIYKDIAQKLPRSINSIAIVPLGSGSGSTVLTRALSEAIHESRKNLATSQDKKIGNVFVVDCAREKNDLIRWYGNKKTIYSYLYSFFNYINEKGSYPPSIEFVFPEGAEGQYFLKNSPDKNAFVELTIGKMTQLIEYVEMNRGTAIYECDPNNQESTFAAVLAAQYVIFVAPVSNKTPDKIGEFARTLSAIEPDRAEEIMRNSSVVTMGTNKSFNTKKGLGIIKKIHQACAASSHIDDDRFFYVPFDAAMSSPPLKWKSVSYVTKTRIRKIAAQVFNGFAQA